MTKKRICLILAAILVCSIFFSAPMAYADELPFTDVKTTSWYYNAVCWAYENNLVSGTTPTTFSPNQSCTRAQIVMILWALAGKPVVEFENPFTDVAPRHYYYKAVMWAVANKITSGVEVDQFGPNLTCTRAQAMTFIWKYFGSPVCEPEVQFTDVAPGRYYYNAVNWAFSNGITSGTSRTEFSPNADVTRAMVVTFLYHMKHVLDGGEHEFVLSNEVPATCTEGSVKTYTCSCGNKKTLYGDDALGHDYVYTILKEPTCTEDGLEGDVCSRCGDSLTSVVYALGHDFLVETITPATCTEDGLEKRTCNRCGFSEDYVVNALGHEYVIDVIVPATCTENGLEHRTCTRCGESGDYVVTAYGHDYVVTVVEPTCTEAGYTEHTCSRCGDSYSENPTAALGHEFCKAELVSDATYSEPTKYKIVCFRCGQPQDNVIHSLGLPILREPIIQSNYNTHQWTEEELANGIHITSSDGASATITRKWFANAWCYIADMELPLGAYDHFTGTNIVNMYGSNNSSYYTSAYHMMYNVPEALIMFNGDTQLYNDLQTMRAGQYYTGKNNRPTCGWSVTYWNPSDGTFGTVRDLLGTIHDPNFTTLLSLGITDLYCFRNATIAKGKMDMEEFASELDYDANSYLIKQQDKEQGTHARRQCTMLGFKREGDTVHVIFAVADGTCYINYNATNPYNWANDRASYGNNKREMMILLSTLGVQHGANLDGGHSAAMIVRCNGVIEQVNASDCSQKTGYSALDGRELWDFLYFK